MNNLNLVALRALRKSKKIKLLEISEALGYKTETGYHNLENGKRRIVAYQLPIIANTMGISIEELCNLLFNAHNLTKYKKDKCAV
ncbi:helix-turn-helix transcriptional regulator [Hazenella sp. IB182357]|uniref:Helix-turn-helix transcriptional regulator n=1 Tax=Polycladospora coralii TaxID=2771432 RepID=A0A926NED5_9BACL|nr:helix-turn-helix transcriptional regulator [Polycladospora coralii]MBD1373880.1 helix-turn-helix transcriptional regulator [Polycladospora coralii]